MVIKGILSFIVFLNGFTAHAQTWNVVGKASDGSLYYMRSNSVAQEGNALKVWVKHTVEKLTIKKKGKPYTYTNGHELILYEFDCEEQKLLLHSYFADNAAGTVVHSYKPEDYQKEWQDVIPETIGEVLLEKACKLKADN